MDSSFWQSRPTSARIRELDGLCRIAILLVLIWHFVLSRIGDSFPLFSVLALSQTGVDLFFVLSGFLLGGILLDHRESPNYYQAFYTHRICRIFPLYDLWLFVPRWVNATLFGNCFNTVIPSWAYFTFTQNFLMAWANHFGLGWLCATWSLAVEEQFYFVLPLLILLTPPRTLACILAILIVAAAILRVIMIYVPAHNGFPNTLLLPTRMDTLLFGVAAAYLLHQEHGWAWLGRARRYLGPSSVFLSFLIAGLAFAGWSLAVLSNAYRFTLMALFYTTLLLIVVTDPQSLVARCARDGLLCRLGIWAYAIYPFSRDQTAKQWIMGSAHIRPGSMSRSVLTQRAF